MIHESISKKRLHKTNDAMRRMCAALSFGLLSFLANTASVGAQEAAAEQRAALEQEARQLVQAFAGELKPRLLAAMKEGGPTHAIEICASAAPSIAEELSEKSGWNVSRVSLKQRNQDRAQPDQWERSQLQDFEGRQRAGESPAQINTSEVVEGRFRYMQAQGVEGVCLACHGEAIAPAVQDTLNRFYPHDQATGYELGEIRGAITLSRELP